MVCSVPAMSISFNSALGPHTAALQLRSQRAEVLANNLANADTPHFKARDFDFKSTLAGLIEGADTQTGVGIHKTHANHLSLDSSEQLNQLKYRLPTMPSLDGNTVDGHEELAAYAENTLQFQASMRFVEGRFKGLLAAIRGE